MSHRVQQKGYMSTALTVIRSQAKGCAEAETPILWPPDVKNWLTGKDWCWERLTAGEEGDNRGWDGWMASPTQWTWVWVSSGRCWWTGRPGMLQSTGSQRVEHDCVTELNWTGRVKKTKSKTETHWSQKRLGNIHKLMILFILSSVHWRPQPSHSASIQIWF